jgi:PAS domain S-box-containing protein
LINRKSEELFGVTNEEAKGKTATEIFPKEMGELFAAHDQAVVESKQLKEEEEKFDFDDGVHTFLTVKFPIFDGDGNAVATGAIGTDITEREKVVSDAMRLGQALDDSPIEIFFIDLESRRFLEVNRTARENLGYSTEELNKMTPADIGPNFDPVRMKSLTGILTSGEQKHVRYETVNRRKDGSDYLIELRLELAQYRDTSAILAIGEDITARKQAEIALREAKEHAEIANRSKSEFLANMSHELRTPLNAVIGFSEMIMGRMLGPIGNTKYLEYAKDINASGQHLLALINDILDLSKIEAGKLELHEQVVDVTEVLGASMTLVKERAEEAELNLEMYVSNGLPAIVADQIKVKQAIINLLSNAVKFTGPGGTVSVHAYIETDGNLAIRVADTGAGIAAEDILRVMEPFGQTDNSLTRQHQGTGLGLPLSKALIELHEGTLVLESELGVGTTVTIRFPAERVRDCAA